jgi:hypothetical protein
MRLKTFLMTVAAGAVISGTAIPGFVWAWGSTGHRTIGEEAVRALPTYVPGFLRTAKAATDIGEFAREPDRWRNSGQPHDDDRDPEHFINLNDDGTTLAGTTLDNLPLTREAYEQSLAAKGATLSKSGFLPYAEAAGYQQIVKDFAYWRILSFMEMHETDKAQRAWYHADRIRREELTTRDIGILAHFVGDATQPMHVSIHYNGWGNFPNPNGFTQEHIHWPLESAYVLNNVSPADVRKSMPDYVPCTDAPPACFAVRLKASLAQVIPLFQLEKDGGFKDGDPRGKAFMTKQIAQGAADLRDVILDAWRESKTMGVGNPMPGTAYDDFVAGHVKAPFDVLHGND